MRTGRVKAKANPKQNRDVGSGSERGKGPDPRGKDSSQWYTDGTVGGLEPKVTLTFILHSKLHC